MMSSVVGGAVREISASSARFARVHGQSGCTNITTVAPNRAGMIELERGHVAGALAVAPSVESYRVINTMPTATAHAHTTRTAASGREVMWGGSAAATLG